MRLSATTAAHLKRVVALLFQSPFARFSVVGSVGVVIDMALLFALSDPSTLAFGVTVSKFLAAEAALICNFIGNELWTFAAEPDDRRATPERWKRFYRFHCVCGIGIPLNAALLHVQFSYFDINRYAANAVSIAAVATWNYSLNKHITWRAVRNRAAVSGLATFPLKIREPDSDALGSA